MKLGNFTFYERHCREFFADKGEIGEAITSAEPVIEMRHRVMWLDIGCLEYNMTQFEVEPPSCHTEEDVERKLFAAFIEYVESLKKDNERKSFRCRAKGHEFKAAKKPDVCPKCREENGGECGGIWLSQIDEIKS